MWRCPTRCSADELVTTAVEFREITKEFPGVVANDRVTMRIREGSVHALVGENGAGKSTLVRILYGLEQADSGSMTLRGLAHRPRSPLDAIAAGVGMVHQHFKLFDSLSVAENIAYGAEPTRRGMLDSARMARDVRELSGRYGLEVDPLAVVAHLAVGVRQRVEVLKALHRKADVLLLDEPTAVLTPGETDEFLAMMRSLAGSGKTVVLITHKLREVMAVSDSVTVMRGGRVTAEMPTSDTTASEIAAHMVGHEQVPHRPARTSRRGATVLAVAGLEVLGSDRRPAVRGVTFDVAAGEIVGLAGVSGNGQRELVEAVVGLRAAQGGTVTIDGADVTAVSAGEVRRLGVAHVPEDRLGDGVAEGASLAENLAMGHHRATRHRRGPWIDRSAVASTAEAVIARYDIRANGPAAGFATLSGGNQQKAVVGRELLHSGSLIIMEQPTRGVDVGAIDFIHRRMISERGDGRGILLVSSELSELTALSDRVLVMFDGRIVGEVSGPDYDEHELGEMMVGLRGDTA